jgi:uncharacterized coiled-coil DUF342 family protein
MAAIDVQEIQDRVDKLKRSFEDIKSIPRTKDNLSTIYEESQEIRIEYLKLGKEIGLNGNKDLLSRVNNQFKDVGQYIDELKEEAKKYKAELPTSPKV